MMGLIYKLDFLLVLGDIFSGLFLWKEDTVTCSYKTFILLKKSMKDKEGQ